jgi:signal transduction histidine kinase
LFLASALLAAAALSVTAALMAAAGPAGHPALVAVARGLIVGVPIVAGLYAWCDRMGERFGLVLIGTGVVWFLTTFAESTDAGLYTFGRTAGWFAEILLVYLFVTYPDGRLTSRIDRGLVLLAAGVVAVAFVPRLVLAEDFATPSPYTSCTRDCPPNALFALHQQPAFLDGLLKPIGALLVVVVMLLVVVRLRDRIRAATPLARRLLVPILAVAAARAVLLATGFVLREADPTTLPVRITSWSLALAVPAFAITFLFAVVRWHLFAGRALERLGQRLRVASDVRLLRDELADAFGDRTLELALPASDGRGWVDSAGGPIAVPPKDESQASTEVRHRGQVIAAVVHDSALAADPRLLQAATGMAAVALDNRFLADEAATAAQEIWRSRARMVAGAERERRRIERDLHDGAQQRLVALRIELELAEELVRRDPESGAARLRELERGVDEALEEVRSLAHGVYPPLLADQGVTEALRAASRKSPIRVDIAAEGVERYTPEVESAVYFCILEAIQNALKHAEGAHRITVRLDGHRAQELRFTVRDDGAGTPDGEIHAGRGIANMRDRLAAVGGEVRLSATPHVGTAVRGHLPLPPAQRS